jgi:hypothetical protein
MLTRPRDREVDCYASAWNMDGKGDVRIKQCIQTTEEDLYTIYHELGHIYYYVAYLDQPILFQTGAHDGFHEAIGDTINLSMTEDYLAGVGLLPKGTKSSREALINRQMKVASEKIAFLPFGKLVDQWRWACSRVRFRRRSTTRPGGTCAADTRAWRRPSRGAKRTSTRARSTTCRATRPTRAISCRS